VKLDPFNELDFRIQIIPRKVHVFIELNQNLKIKHIGFSSENVKPFLKISFTNKLVTSWNDNI
jgi:hypothetical protein